MRKYRKWREIVIEQLAGDWDAALDYIQFAMEEYQVDGNTAVFLLALRTFIESQGDIAELSEKTSVDREFLSKMLSSEEAPRLDMLVTILTALGCKLSIKPLRAEGFRGEKDDVDAVLATSEGIKPDIVFARDNK